MTKTNTEAVNRGVFDKLEKLMARKLNVKLEAMTLRRTDLTLEWSSGKRMSSMTVPLSDLKAELDVPKELMRMAAIGINADRELTRVDT